MFGLSTQSKVSLAYICESFERHKPVREAVRVGQTFQQLRQVLSVVENFVIVVRVAQFVDNETEKSTVEI